MKESRFIELLNLYVDHQLTPAEAAELEREIQQNPKHRRTYQQYCRMQKACSQLFEKERVNAPASPRLVKALSDADRKIVRFPERAPSIWSRGLIGTALAAAAAVAAIVLIQGPQAGQNDGAAIATTTPVAKPVADAAVMPVATTRTEAPAANHALFPLRIQKSEEVLAARKEDAAAAFAQGAGKIELFDWMQTVELRPIPSTTDERFALQPASRALVQPIGVTPANVVPAQPGDEMIGFQYKR